jgi:hypothetical protein
MRVGRGVCMGLVLMAGVTTGGARAAEMRDGVGVVAGYVRGVGFSYLHHTPERWAVGAVALGLTTNGGFAYNVGGTVQRTLSGGTNQRLYVGAAGVVIHRVPENGLGYTDGNIGLLIGIEQMLSPEWAGSLELCEAWITRHGDVILTPAVGLHYYF